MGRTFKQPGHVWTHQNGSGSDIDEDDVVVMGDTVGIALVNIPDGEGGSVSVEGVHEVPKTTGTAWAQGDKIDWDASAEEFHLGVTPAAGDVTDCGVAAEAAASGDAVALLRLTPGTGAAQ